MAEWNWSKAHSSIGGTSVYAIAFKDIGKPEIATANSNHVFVVYDEDWTTTKLGQLIERVPNALVLNIRGNEPHWRGVIDEAHRRLRHSTERNRLLEQSRRDAREWEELSSEPDRFVGSSVEKLERQKKSMQSQLQRARRVVSFVHELSEVLEMDGLLQLLRREFKEQHDLEAPHLFVPRGEKSGDLFHLQGTQVFCARLRETDWDSSMRFRSGLAKDSRFLANALGRPVGSVLSFPLLSMRYQKDPRRAPVVFFEHRLPAPEVEHRLHLIGERLQLVSWALDRLLLETDLKSTSRDWAATFDELHDPIAILSKEGRVLRSNSHWTKECERVAQSDGALLRLNDRVFSVERYPIHDESGTVPESWVVYLRDQTRSHQLKGQVVQVEKMSALGQLAGHIAHELNNPLTGIRSLAQLLVTETEAEPRLKEDLQEVESAAARCQNIINNLLDYSRGSLKPKVEKQDLNLIVSKTLPFLKTAMSPFRQDIDLANAPMLVSVEPQLIQQVIFNLVSNACQAMRTEGELHIRTKKTATHALILIVDDGPGIPDAIQSRLFEPFFTTKREGEGTGLGLSLSRDLVRRFGGDISFASKPGVGTTFQIELPLSEK